MLRLLLTARWLARTAVVLLAVAVLAWLGWWQWGRGESAQGTLRNLLYAFQWWVFAGFVVLAWWRTLRDELAPRPVADPVEPVGRAAVVAPVPASAASPPAEEDEELAAYNAYLAWLNANPRS